MPSVPTWSSWVPDWDFSWRRGYQIADCGLFRGEWPPYAPLVFPSGAERVGILVCLPPPSRNLSDLHMGLYPTPFVFAVRTGIDSWFGEYEPTATGGYTGSLDTPPEGMHLYALWYTSATPPVMSLTPLEVVPQGMVAGSTGPARGGRKAVNGAHWSAWQTYGTKDFPYQYFSSYNFNDAHGSVVNHLEVDTSSDSGWPNVATILNSQLADIRSGSGLDTNPLLGDRQHTGFLFSGFKSNRSGGFLTAHWSTRAQIQQGIASYIDLDRSEDLDELPPLLQSMEYGTGFLDPPEAELAGQIARTYVIYETLATRIGWRDWTTKRLVGVTSGNLGVVRHDTFNARLDSDGIGTTEYSDYSASFRYAALPTATEFTAPIYPPDVYAYDRVPTDPSFFAWGAGTELATFTTGPIPSTGSYMDQVTLPLSVLGNTAEFTLVVQPQFLGPDAQPVADFTPTPDETNPSIAVSEQYTYAMAVNHSGIERPFNVDTADPLYPWAEGPVSIYQEPRFKYWVPGPIPAYIPLGDLRVGDTGRPPIIFW